jgi:uncharacterized coiled-coil DUF342 family protein
MPKGYKHAEDDSGPIRAAQRQELKFKKQEIYSEIESMREDINDFNAEISELYEELKSLKSRDRKDERDRVYERIQNLKHQREWTREQIGYKYEEIRWVNDQMNSL